MVETSTVVPNVKMINHTYTVFVTREGEEWWFSVTWNRIVGTMSGIMLHVWRDRCYQVIRHFFFYYTCQCDMNCSSHITLINTSILSICCTFHFLICTCIYIVAEGTNWYCSDDCALGSESDDPVQAYARNMLWSGLNLLARRYSVRQGNGSDIVKHWKMDLVHSLWRHGHCHYLKIAHRFLACKYISLTLSLYIYTYIHVFVLMVLILV